ncbi:hypothetical protein DFQ26_003180 [Actinomortierella ambigua]|nr:hypothetical protein DFQ26_003180 [Actinomortierella ambigua]
MATKETNPHNFANLPKDELRSIAAKGGRHSHHPERNATPEEMEQTADDDHPSRGFAAMSPEKQHEIASKGGHAAQVHAGFTNMDPDKHHEAAVKGGHVSQAHGGGFANMSKDRLHEVATKGGRAMQYKAHHGGFQPQESDSGATDDVEETGTHTEGGEHVRGFAAMAAADPDKHKAISAKGGRHSHGQHNVTE